MSLFGHCVFLSTPQAVDEDVMAGLGVWRKGEPTQHYHPPTGKGKVACPPHTVGKSREVSCSYNYYDKYMYTCSVP